MFENDYFIDRLDVTQDYDFDLPVIAKSLVEERNFDTGEITKYHTLRPHKGSYSTHLTIKTNGNRLYISGNPSRFNRLDNLFGYQSIEQCLQLYNVELKKLGLPQLTVNTSIKSVFNNKTKKFDVIGNGVRIRRIDITRNYCVGYGNEKHFISAVSQASINNNHGYVYPNGYTVDWMRGSRMRYIKMYCKWWSLKEQRPRSGYELNELEYYDRLTEWCIRHGVVRLEYEYKSKFLDRYGYSWYGVMNNVYELANRRDVENYMDNLGVNVTDLENISDDLLFNGIVKSRQAANSTQMYFMQWLAGQDLRHTMGKSQFYTHRNRLLQLGYDISQKINVQKMPLRAKIRTIEVKNLDLPVWYNRSII